MPISQSNDIKTYESVQDYDSYEFDHLDYSVRYDSKPNNVSRSTAQEMSRSPDHEVTYEDVEEKLDDTEVPRGAFACKPNFAYEKDTNQLSLVDESNYLEPFEHDPIKITSNLTVDECGYYSNVNY